MLSPCTVADLRPGDVFSADGVVASGTHRVVAIGRLPGQRKLYIDDPSTTATPGPFTRRQLSRLLHFILGQDVQVTVHERSRDAPPPGPAFIVGVDGPH